MHCFAQIQLKQTLKKEKESKRGVNGVHCEEKDRFLLLIHPTMMLTPPPDAAPSSQTPPFLPSPNRRTSPSSILGSHRSFIQDSGRNNDVSKGKKALGEDMKREREFVENYVEPPSEIAPPNLCQLEEPDTFWRIIHKKSNYLLEHHHKRDENFIISFAIMKFFRP
jgi:hypothetical protein